VTATNGHRSDPARPATALPAADTTPALRPVGGFWVAAATIVITLWTSAAPALAYPLYAAQWDLTPTVTTALFAVYPAALVVMLIVVGNVSDYTGRRPAILTGMSGCLLGSALFAIGASIGWLFLGRAVMGVGVAFALSAATAAMVEYSPPHQGERASAVATAASALGLTVALLLGGALVQYGPAPTHLSFWALTAVTTVITASCWFLPRDVAAPGPESWRPRPPRIRRGLRGLFATAALAVSIAYVTGGVMLSLGSQIAKDLVASDNAFTNGAMLALLPVVMGVTAVAGRRVPAPILILGGGTFTVLGVAALFASAQWHSLPWFLVAAAASGVGYGGTFLGGLTLVADLAPAEHRGAVTSAVYLLAYVAQGSIALALGVVATLVSLHAAVDAGCIAIGVCALGVILARVLLLRRAAEPGTPEGEEP
jgi:MFS family permease